MAFDAFMKIDGIPGESTDSKYKDWISVLSYSHSITQTGSGARHDAGAASAGRADHGPFTVTKNLDKASPKLAAAVSSGEHIPTITIALNRATKDKQKFMEITLSDVLVTSYAPSAEPAGSSALPSETVGFSYGKIAWTYTQTDHATGKPQGDIKTTWDLTTNKGG